MKSEVSTSIKSAHTHRGTTVSYQSNRGTHLDISLFAIMVQQFQNNGVVHLLQYDVGGCGGGGLGWESRGGGGGDA